MLRGVRMCLGMDGKMYPLLRFMYQARRSSQKGSERGQDKTACMMNKRVQVCGEIYISAYY